MYDPALVHDFAPLMHALGMSLQQAPQLHRDAHKQVVSATVHHAIATLTAARFTTNEN